MNRGSAASLRLDPEGAVTSSPPLQEGDLSERVLRIERMVQAIYEAFLGHEGPAPSRDAERSLLPFNMEKYQEALREARRGNFRAIRSYLARYHGRAGG